MSEIDTTNKCLVCVSSKGIGMINLAPLREGMTPDDALVLAAWLVAIAEAEATLRFEDVLEAVKST